MFSFVCEHKNLKEISYIYGSNFCLTIYLFFFKEYLCVMMRSFYFETEIMSLQEEKEQGKKTQQTNLKLLCP